MAAPREVSADTAVASVISELCTNKSKTQHWKLFSMINMVSLSLNWHCQECDLPTGSVVCTLPMLIWLVKARLTSTVIDRCFVESRAKFFQTLLHRWFCVTNHVTYQDIYSGQPLLKLYSTDWGKCLWGCYTKLHYIEMCFKYYICQWDWKNIIEENNAVWLNITANQDLNLKEQRLNQYRYDIAIKAKQNYLRKGRIYGWTVGLVCIKFE